ncbi:MAG: mechanosensitive ion channel domain-containing protein [Nanoarchaeota archaeon]
MADGNLTQAYSIAVSQTLSGIFTKVLLAVIILLLGFIIGRIAGKLVLRFLQDLRVNRFLQKRIGTSLYFEEAAGLVVSYGIYIITIIQSLNSLGITLMVANVLLAVSVFIILLFIVLAVKDFVPNLFAGIYIHSKRRIQEGMLLRIKNTSGEIVSTGLLETTIKTGRGERIIIPNVLFLHEKYQARNR